MRTERRHELQTNELAKDIAIGFEKFKPYTNQMIAAVGGLFVLFGLLTYWQNSRKAHEQVAWESYENAVLASDRELTSVQKLIEDDAYAGTSTQEWAAINWADRQLLIAANELLINRDSANDRLEAVAGLYSEFAQSAGTEEIRNRARLGTARIHDLRNEVDEAIAAYQLVGGELKEIAADRIDSLESPLGSDAAKWLADAKFAIPKSPSGPGTPGVRPEFGAAQPTADGEDVEFDPNRSLEDIISGLNDQTDEAGDDRYDEKQDGDKQDAVKSTEPADSSAAPADDAASAKSADDGAGDDAAKADDAK